MSVSGRMASDRFLAAAADDVFKLLRTALPYVPHLFHNVGMAQHLIDSPYDLHHLAREGLMLSPGWARVGLTFGDERLREQAINELAASIAQRISNPPVEADPNQLRLAL